jgi:hypothetical protein
MVVRLNGREICTSKAYYGASMRIEGNQSASNWTTISYMTECDDIIPVKKGDTISVDVSWYKVAHPL